MYRYPKPRKVIVDNSFDNKEFREILESYGVKLSITSPRNPQSNSVVEIMQFAFHNKIRCTGAKDWHKCLPAISRSIRSSYHNSIATTPGEMIYGRNMVLNEKVDRNSKITKAIQTTKNQRTKDVNAQNKKRIIWKYNIGDQVFIRTLRKSKLGRKFEGPFTITKVNRNCTVHVDKEGTDLKINIRKLKPFKTGEEGQDVMAHDIIHNIDKKLNDIELNCIELINVNKRLIDAELNNSIVNTSHKLINSNELINLNIAQDTCYK